MSSGGTEWESSKHIVKSSTTRLYIITLLDSSSQRSGLLMHIRRRNLAEQSSGRRKQAFKVNPKAFFAETMTPSYLFSSPRFCWLDSDDGTGCCILCYRLKMIRKPYGRALNHFWFAQTQFHPTLLKSEMMLERGNAETIHGQNQRETCLVRYAHIFLHGLQNWDTACMLWSATIPRPSQYLPRFGQSRRKDHNRDILQQSSVRLKPRRSWYLRSLRLPQSVQNPRLVQRTERRSSLWRPDWGALAVRRQTLTPSTRSSIPLQLRQTFVGSSLVVVVWWGCWSVEDWWKEGEYVAHRGQAKVHLDSFIFPSIWCKIHSGDKMHLQTLL